VKWGHGSSLSDYSESADAQGKQTIKFKTGGVIQFGCLCSNGGPANEDTFDLKAGNGTGTALSCTSKRYNKRLSMQLFVNGSQQRIGESIHDLGDEEVRCTEVDTAAMHRVELTVGDPTYIVSTYKLQDANKPLSHVNSTSFGSLDEYLGISITSINMTDRIWTAICSTNYEASEAIESCVVGRCVIGRCVEQILCVAAIPFQQGVRSGAISTNKETQVECIDTREAHEIALLCNIIAPQHVDVQSAL
jgi:hypothetical protein